MVSGTTLKKNCDFFFYSVIRNIKGEKQRWIIFLQSKSNKGESAKKNNFLVLPLDAANSYTLDL